MKSQYYRFATSLFLCVITLSFSSCGNSGNSDSGAVNGSLIASSFDGNPQYEKGITSADAPLPHIYDILPDIGSTAGNTLVHIVGCNFSNPPVAKVYFGTMPAKSFYILSDTEIYAQSPENFLGTVDILMANKYGRSRNTDNDNYQYETIPGDAISFEPTLTFQTLSSGRAIIWSDFDRDCKADIACSNFPDARFSILRNSTVSIGDIDFDDVAFFDTLPYGNDILSADLDGNLYPEIIIANRNVHKLSIHLNTTASTQSISFASQIELATGNHPGYIAAADFDSDGKADLVSSNEQADTLSIFRNISSQGQIALEDRVDLSVGDEPEGIAVGDFNLDGKADIALCHNYGHALHVLINASEKPGHLKFDQSYILSVDTPLLAICAADINNDNRLDLVTANLSTDNLSVFINQTEKPTALQFGPPINLQTNDGPYDVQAADLNGDGLLDIVSSDNLGNKLSVFKNVTSDPNNPQFEPKIDLLNGSSNGIALIDFDLDGRTDCASCYGSGSVHLLRNDYFIPDTPPAQGAPIINHVCTNVGSENGNAQISIIGEHFQSPTVSNLRFGATPVMHFQVKSDAEIIAFTPTGSGIVDITAENALGISPNTIADNYYYVDTTESSISFGTPIILAAPTGPDKVECGDFNGDGLLDLAIGNYGTQDVLIYRNVSLGQGDFSFTAQETYYIGGWVKGLEIADFNCDQKLDIAVSTYQGTEFILRNISNGSGAILFESIDISEPDFSSQILVGFDFDKDGRPDLLGSGFQNVFGMRNISSGSTIQFDSLGNVGQWIYGNDSIAWDFDLDGKTDVASSDDDARFAVLRNKSLGLGDIDFEIYSFGGGSYNHLQGLVVGDFDLDGKIDIAATVANSLSAYRNTSTNQNVSFQLASSQPTLLQPFFASSADYDGDGKLDVSVVNNVPQKIAIYGNLSQGPGDVTFSPMIQFPTGSYPHFLTSGDFDLDGRIDIVVANFGSNTLMIFPN